MQFILACTLLFRDPILPKTFGEAIKTSSTAPVCPPRPPQHIVANCAALLLYILSKAAILGQPTVTLFDDNGIYTS